jgi:hypothetical protein
MINNLFKIYTEVNKQFFKFQLKDLNYIFFLINRCNFNLKRLLLGRLLK